MTTLIAAYLFLFAGVLVVLVARQYFTGRHPLMTVRNVAIPGLIIFQITSAALRLHMNVYEPFTLSEPVKTGLMYAAWVTTFSLLMLVAYRTGWGAKRLANLVPIATHVPSPATMLLMAAVLVGLGLALRLGGVPVRSLAILADFFGTGFAAMAAGLVGWVWARRLLNLPIVVYAGVIILLGLVTVMTGSFGRRGLVAIGGGLVFGMYYGVWRTWRPWPVIGRLVLVAVVPLVFLALYSSVRSAGEHDRTAGQHLQAIQSRGDIKSGLVMLLDGQNTGAESLWLAEAYPDQYESRPFFTLYYTFGVMIPREIWPDKPEPLSNKVAAQAKVDQVNRDRIKLAPGILGSAAAEGGWFAVVVYGILAGLFLRFFDELISRAPWSPFVVLPVASNLGQVLGLARGETSVFANTYILTVVGCWFTMLLVGKFAERIRGQPAGEQLTTDPASMPDEDETVFDADPYAEHVDYGPERAPA